MATTSKLSRKARAALRKADKALAIALDINESVERRSNAYRKYDDAKTNLWAILHAELAQDRLGNSAKWRNMIGDKNLGQIGRN